MIEVTAPGVYPLETRECERCSGTGKCPHCWGLELGKPWWESCETCHGTGRVPDEKGPKVEIKQHPCGTYFWNIGKGWLPLAIGMPTPAEAYAAALEAHRREEAK